LPDLGVAGSSPNPAGATAARKQADRLMELQELGPLSLFPFGPDFHSILSLIGDGVVSTDQNGRIVLFNRAAEEIFGYNLDEVLGRPIDLLIPKRFRERHREDFAQFFSSPVPLRRSMGAGREVMGLRKDGGELSIEATLSRQMISAHPIVTVVVRDVSDRKRAEIQNQTVAKEVAHRLQNTMAVVNSIVSLTSRSAASVTDFKEALLGRFAAISRTNASLIGGLTAAADLRALLGSELAAFHEDGKIALTGPKVSLSGEIAVALALVIHELATNAAKYGSLSDPNGSLRVDWHVPGDGRPALQLNWQEANGPAVEPPSRNGFGTSLISRSLASHGGNAELDFHVSGVICKISLPLA
jgi:PAS domain S-box-containing protein